MTIANLVRLLAAVVIGAYVWVAIREIKEDDWGVALTALGLYVLVAVGLLALARHLDSRTSGPT